MAQVGDLEVMVLGATQLKDVENWGKQDPYVSLDLSGQKFTTKTKTDAGKKPVWNERFNFVNINSQYSTEMLVKVADRNVMVSDTLIGTARIPLMRVYASRATEEMRVQLATEKGKTAGELQLLLTFKPYNAAAPHPHAAQLQHMPHPAAPHAAYGTVPGPSAPGYGAPSAPMYSTPPAPSPTPMYGMPPAQQPSYAGYPPAQAPQYGAPGYPLAQASQYGAPGYPPAQAPQYGAPGYPPAQAPQYGAPGYPPAQPPQYGAPGYPPVNPAGQPGYPGYPTL